MILVVFILGAFVGVGGAYAWYDAWRVHMLHLAEKSDKEWADQVKELRAQVARHINVTTCECHGVKDCPSLRRDQVSISTSVKPTESKTYSNTKD
jgi:hypothetical protein